MGKKTKSSKKTGGKNRPSQRKSPPEQKPPEQDRARHVTPAPKTPSAATATRRSRRISNQTTLPPAQDTNTTEAAPLDVTPVAEPSPSPSASAARASTNSTPEGRTKEGAKKRNGLHPITGLRVRNCICTTPAECREIMWRFASIGAKEQFPYFKLPGKPKKDATPTGKHVIGYRKNVFHHLFGHGSSSIVQDIEDSDRGVHIALIHFPPPIRKYIVEGRSQSMKQFKFRVPLDVGRECQLTELDLCQTKDEAGNDSQTFYASPNAPRNLSDAYLEVAEAEREYRVRRAAIDPSTPSPARHAGRKTPKERELDMLTREAEANPRAFALRMQDKDAEIAALKEQLKNQQAAAAKREEELKAELQKQHDLLTAELISTGLTRRCLVNDDYHAKKPWLAKYFYGRPWNEHKARGRALFGNFVEGFDCNVTGKEKHITQFEQYSICVMIARKGYSQPAMGAIYDRDRTSISRYMALWMPRLGEAGGDLSELDMEMNHNFFELDYLKEEGLSFMLEGEAMKEEGVPLDLIGEEHNSG